MTYNVGSLFAGVGGICLGFKRADERFVLSFANEMDKAACTTYSANFDHDLIEGDIEKILNPNLIFRERDFLLTRLNELSNIEIKNYNEQLIKDCIKSLNDPFFVSVLMKGNFDLTDNLKKKISKFGYDEDEFKKFIEYKLIQINLENCTEENLNIQYEELIQKNEQIKANRIDILTAGFPCQAFSIAGDRKGFSDHRGELFYSVINLVNQLQQVGHGKPRVLFLENVKNLVNHDDGNTFKVIKSELENLGYTLKYKVLNTYKYTTLPQNRERIFVVCFLNKADAEAFGSFDTFTELNRTKEELRESLANILDYNNISYKTNPELYYTREKYPQYFMTEEEFLKSGKDEWINLNTDINEMYEIYQVRRGMYVRKNQSGVCPTLTANMGTGGHNVPLILTHDGIRKLSPKDCFNLQGFRVGTDYRFPDKLKSAALYKQSGNAVSVDVIELIARRIIEAFLIVDNNMGETLERTNQAITNENESTKLIIENYLDKQIQNRFRYFRTKKYKYFKKRVLKKIDLENLNLKQTNISLNLIINEDDKLYTALFEINETLNKTLNKNISTEELQKIRKKIMLKLSETL